MSDRAKRASNREFELKLLLPPGGAEKLRRSALWRRLRAGGAVKHLHSTYYDSADRRLLQNGFTLRIRRDGKAAEQTLKWDGAGGEPLARTEWNWPLTRPEAAVEALAEVDPLGQVEGFDPANLEPLCEVVYRRQTRLWQEGETTLELALDAGQISGEAGSEALSELEIELKSGEPGQVFVLARSVNELMPVSPALKSKGERGLTLPAAGEARWCKARPLDLDASMTLDEVLGQVVGASLEHLSRNLACARLGNHPEGVHQVRVAIRRLRATLKLFANVLPEASSSAFDKALRDLARELGPVRDLDVFRHSLLQGARRASSSERSLDQLDRAAAGLQQAAQARATRALTQPAFGRLTIDLHEWLALRLWRTGGDDAAAAALFRPATEIVGPRLDRLHRKVLKQGEGFDELGQDARHELRIAIKRLRYAVDLYGPLYKRKKVRAYRKRLEALQEQLGDSNDVVAAEGILRQILLSHASHEFTLTAGAVLGWLRARASGQEGSVADEWQAFAGAARPWR